MSAYITLATPMIDQECLLLALRDVGFTQECIEVHGEPVQLVGYEGRQRQQLAHIIVRRKHVGRASNDIGFERTTTGFQAHISGYDHPRYGGSWLKRVHVRYAEHNSAKQERLAKLEDRRLAEIEARRREEERQNLVEAQRKAVREKARKMGYRVKETREGERIRLVLVKRVY